MRRHSFWRIAFLAALCAVGGSIIYLCSRFEGFSHPLGIPLLLGGACMATALLYLCL